MPRIKCGDSYPDITQEELELLEIKFIDLHGMAGLLRALEFIAVEKAVHLETVWADWCCTKAWEAFKKSMRGSCQGTVRYFSETKDIEQ